MKVPKSTACLLLSLLAFPAVAGGDYAQGFVSAFQAKGGAYTFRFTQTEQQALVPGCPSFAVSVLHRRVPWYTWLPFVQSSHPTEQETAAAASFLRAAALQRRLVSFGYMGNGLVGTDSSCSFTANGLKLGKDERTIYVLAFHDPV